MSLTAEEMQALVSQLEKLCQEAKELQIRLQQAMADRARGDMPFRPPAAERRTKSRKPR
jgi:hypothetical protein